MKGEREVERMDWGEDRPGTRAGQVVEPLRYLTPGGNEPVAEAKGETDGGPEREWEARLAAKEAECASRCEAVRQEALTGAHAEAEGERVALLRRCAEEWSEAVREFTASRDQYFARVEREVVELALAIAARILQREAQVDPLLLTGAVRVALGQLAESTAVELRVPAPAHEMWAETLRLMPNLPVTPTVVADGEMKEGECVLTTELGRVDLGVRAQLKEVERGFFDLLSHRAPVPGRETARPEL
jgi:flagellar assembly protein FliH